MRRAPIITLVALILSLAVLLAGCGPTPPKVSNWSVTVNSYRFATRVEDEILSDYWYYPDEGYQWLIVSLTLKNNRTSDGSLNWFMDNIDYASSSGNSHDMHLVYNGVKNELPTSYNPGQVKTGDIFFEVPLAENVAAGRLYFRFWEEDGFTVNMSGVPH